MSAIRWAAQRSGVFSDGADWVGGSAPTGIDVALIAAPGPSPYTVAVQSSASVEGLRVGPKASLDVESGAFTIVDQAASSVNIGSIVVADGASLQLTGVLDNAGTVDLQGTEIGADIEIGASGATLTGGGQVLLSDSLAAPFQPCPPDLSLDQIGGVRGAILTNASDTLIGAGVVGRGVIAFVNLAHGVVNADLATDLILDPTSLTNNGLLTSTGAGGLYVIRTTVKNAGEISANGGIVYFSDCEIVGGVLSSSGAGFFYSDHGSNILDGESKPVSLEGYLFISDGSTVTLEGSIADIGRIDVGRNGSQLLVGAEGATLSGGGAVNLNGFADDSTISGIAAGAVLDNLDDTLDGEGDIGDGSMVLINGVDGRIRASSPAFALTLDTGAETVVNQGVLESASSTFLIIDSPVANSGRLIASGGMVEALEAVTGGGVAVISGGVFEALSSFDEKVTFSGASGELVLGEARGFGAKIRGFRVGDSLDLRDMAFDAGTALTYSGSASRGVLTISDGAESASIHLVGDFLSAHFAYESDGEGGVLITLASMADRASPVIVWTSPAGGVFSNAADWAGGKAPGPTDMAVLGSLGGALYTVASTTSRTLAGLQTDASATLDVQGGVLTLSRGTGAGLNAGSLEVEDGAVVSLGGTVDNTGSIDLLGSSAGADLRIGASGASLNGGGVILLSGRNDQLSGVAGSVLENDDTIEGAGTMGAGQMTIDNGPGGVIDADMSSDLVLEPLWLTNSGLIRATGAGGLSLARTTVNNDGVISADGAVVTLINCQIDGGTLASSAGGLVQVAPGAVILSGGDQPLDLDGDVLVEPASDLVLDGAIDNAASVSVALHAFLCIGTTGASLTGAGVITLSGGKVAGAGVDPILTNVENTISGFGLIGAGALTLVNGASGVITASGVGQSLTLESDEAAITNAGLMSASPLSLLIIDSALNNSGTLLVAGGEIELEGAVSGSGDALISGGTLQVDSGFAGAVKFSGLVGELALQHSQTDAVSVTGFAIGDSIDLMDIAMTGSTDVSYSGAAGGGTLTVTDGTHAAQITLLGDYLSERFIVSSDGAGGTLLNVLGAPTPSATPIAQAAAAFGGASESVAPGYRSQASEIATAGLASIVKAGG